MSNRVHLKGLNGIRAIAALAVVFSHISLWCAPFGIKPAEKGHDLAGFGVTMFFSLSGFLITYLLLLEKEKSDVNIKNFYIRRTLRIWPLYFLYLFASLIAIGFLYPDKLPGSLAFYLLLTANIPFILGTALPFLGHYWSLAVEEQFYLFWPWIIKKVQRPLAFIVAFTVLFMGLRLLFRALDAPLLYLILQVTRFDCMAIGGIGAILFHQRHPVFWKIGTSLGAQLVAWAAVIALALNKFHIASIIDQQIIALLTVVIILNISSNPKTIINLEHSIPDFIGKISYGIYVIHPLIIILMGKYLGPLVSQSDLAIRHLVVYTTIPALTIILAYISYEAYEKRFLRIKESFSSIRSSSTKDATYQPDFRNEGELAQTAPLVYKDDANSSFDDTGAPQPNDNREQRPVTHNSDEQR